MNAGFAMRAIDAEPTFEYQGLTADKLKQLSDVIAGTMALLPENGRFAPSNSSLGII